MGSRFEYASRTEHFDIHSEINASKGDVEYCLQFHLGSKCKMKKEKNKPREKI